MRGRTRVLTAARVVCGLVVASTLLGIGPSARAQGGATTTLGGFTGSAGSSGMKVQYNPVGLLPTGPPIDLSAPDALATIASGPATFARAAISDPGDLLANPDALLAQANAAYEAGTIPAWPFRISASSGVGEPSAESNPAPGLNARVHAEGGSASAQSTAPGAAVPPAVTIGSMAAYAESTTDGTSVTVHARSEISSFDLAGILHIDSIISDVTATSTGGDTTLTGGTVVSGASIAGQPATIDDQGVRAAVAGVDLGPLLDALGLTITLPGPVELDGTSSGALSTAGLHIQFAQSGSTAPGLSDILDALPPIDPIVPGAPSPEDVIALLKAKHVVTIELGRAEVSLTARTPAPRPAPTTPTTAAPTAATPSRPSTATPSAPVARPSATPSAPLASSPAAPVVAEEVPVASVGTGVGALAVLLLLLQPLFGDRLTRAAGAVLASDQEGCPWERR